MFEKPKDDGKKKRGLIFIGGAAPTSNDDALEVEYEDIAETPLAPNQPPTPRTVRGAVTQRIASAVAGTGRGLTYMGPDPQEPGTVKKVAKVAGDFVKGAAAHALTIHLRGTEERQTAAKNGSDVGGGAGALGALLVQSILDRPKTTPKK